MVNPHAHLEAPSALDVVPGGHFVQPVEPAFGAKNAAGHSLQVDDPVFGANEPGGQGLHTSEPAVENWPRGHSLQVSPITPFPPPAQSHVVPSVLLLDRPFGQGMHLAFVPPELNWFDAHCLQNLMSFVKEKRNSPGLHFSFPNTPLEV